MSPYVGVSILGAGLEKYGDKLLSKNSDKLPTKGHHTVTNLLIVLSADG